MSAAVAKPPRIEPAPIWKVEEAEASRIANSPPVEAPVVKPTISGLPRGLRDRLWKMAPDSASIAPTSTAATARGRRWSMTMKRSRSLPVPRSSVPRASAEEML